VPLTPIVGREREAVPPMALPDPGPLPSAASLERFGAVRLFLNRARAVRPAFVVDGQNAGDVVAICRRLDGLALAIELAAARITIFPLQRRPAGVRVQLVRSSTRLRCRRERRGGHGAGGCAPAPTVLCLALGGLLAVPGRCVRLGDRGGGHGGQGQAAV
jgi:hypothetical protein